MNTGLSAALNDPVVGPSNQTKTEAARQLARMMGLGLIGGAGLGVGKYMLGGLSGGPPAPTPGASFVRVPVPVHDRDRERRGPLKAAAAGMARAIKEAGIAVTPPPHATPDLAAAVASPTFKPPGGEQSSLMATLFPHNAKSHWDMPGMIPLVAAGVPLAAYAGYKGVDAIANRGRKGEATAKLEEARRRYHAALLSDRDDKVAAERPPLDLLAEKAAGYLDRLGGGYLTVLGLAAAGTGLGAYSYAREHSQAKAVEDALRRRREQLFAESPTPVVAIPSPYRVDREKERRALAPPIRGPEPKFASMPPPASTPAGAARTTLDGLRQRREAYQRQMLAMQDGGKSRGEARPAPPAPPKLPSLVT